MCVVPHHDDVFSECPKAFRRGSLRYYRIKMSAFCLTVVCVCDASSPSNTAREAGAKAKS